MDNEEIRYPFLFFGEFINEKIRRSFRFARFLSFNFRTGKIHDPTISFDQIGKLAAAFARRQTPVLSDERNGNFTDLDD